MTNASKLAQNAVTKDGFATLGTEATRLLLLLDEVFREWAQLAGASEITLPPVLPVTDLALLDVYQNFPHLAMVATTLDTEKFTDGGTHPEHIGAEDLEASRFGLPSATCYGVYLHLRDRAVDNTLMTVLGTCFRNEQHYDGLRRLGAFRMREIVALGSPEHARAHIDRFTELVLEFAMQAGLSIDRQAANDPFFDVESPQALWQRLVPVKHEFIVDDLAIASVNEHRTFFGERCGIRLSEVSAPISSSCVAFGLERWIAVLTTRYEGDWNTVFEAVHRARMAVDHLRPAIFGTHAKKVMT